MCQKNITTLCRLHSVTLLQTFLVKYKCTFLVEDSLKIMHLSSFVICNLCKFSSYVRMGDFGFFRWRKLRYLSTCFNMNKFNEWHLIWIQLPIFPGNAEWICLCTEKDFNLNLGGIIETINVSQMLITLQRGLHELTSVSK